jgi:hypothetical protein
MMDSDAIRKSLANKEALYKMDDAQRLTFFCEQVYGGDWDAHYAACDFHLVAFGAKAGVNEVPGEELDPKHMPPILKCLHFRRICSVLFQQGRKPSSVYVASALTWGWKGTNVFVRMFSWRSLQWRKYKADKKHWNTPILCEHTHFG